MTNTELESSGIIDGGQHKHYRVTEQIDDVKVRVVIDLDTSHPRSQSSAHADVWSPQAMQWNRAAYLNSGEWTDRSYARPGGDDAEDADILAAVENLLGQVTALLA